MTDVRRPVGVTVTSLVLLWLAVAGFGNALLLPSTLRAVVATPFLRSSEIVTSSVLSGVAFLYGVTALIAAIGLWRMSSWGVRAFLAWGIAAIALMLVFVMLIRFPPDTSAIASAGFAAFMIALLVTWWSYLRKAYERAGNRAL